jgi:hypothetical protein
VPQRYSSTASSTSEIRSPSAWRTASILRLQLSQGFSVRE